MFALIQEKNICSSKNLFQGHILFISRIESDQTLELARTVLIINLNLELDYGGDKDLGMC